MFKRILATQMYNDKLYMMALRQEIENARVATPQETLANVALALVCRSNKYREAKGHHFENSK